MTRRWLAALLFVATPACGRLRFASTEDANALTDDGRVDTADMLAIDAGMPAGLALWVSFDDGTFRDAVTNEVGACVACPDFIPGRVGAGAGSFNGTMDCVAFTNRAALQSPAMTAAMFINVQSTGASSTVMSKPSDTIAGTSNSWEVVRSGATEIHFPSYSGTYEPWQTPAMVPADAWHHVAISYGNGTKRVYLDGVERGSLASPAFVYATDALRIGCDINNSAFSEFFTGFIDEAQVFDRELAASEIAMLAAM